ncbi:MAG: TRAP transporter small permease [Thermotogae bacterium]|nr:TRAP transporter small permease [Thermotogota bacterium]
MLSKYVRIIEFLTGLCLLLMFVIVTMAVVARYVFSSPIFWAGELSRYLMFYMVMLGSSLAIRDVKHPSLTFIVERLPQRLKKIWTYVVYLSVLFVSVIIFWQGFTMASKSIFLRTPALRISFSWIYVGLPIGGALMSLETVLKLVSTYLSSRGKNT